MLIHSTETYFGLKSEVLFVNTILEIEARYGIYFTKRRFKLQNVKAH
jgi:hypothetical protein